MAIETPDFAAAGSLPELYAMLDRVQMKNGWNKPTPSLYPEPKQVFVPARWQYNDARAALHKAGDLVDPKWAERRNLIMANPHLGNDYPTVTTLVGAYQMVKPGETARSHRHTPNAMRLVIEAAPQTYTIVDGVKIPMEPGDVLLTPMGSWHGHSNESAEEAYWIDFLDAPLVQLLGPMFFEHHPDELEKADGVDADSSMRFAFSEYYPRLLASSEIAAGVRMLRLQPPSFQTFDRTVFRLDKGAEFRRSRSTISRIYSVISGSGRSVFEDAAFEWAPGDMIAVPNWQRHTLHAHEDATLLEVSDEPLLAMLGWAREERCSIRQTEQA
ncbi:MULTISPECIES: cupin domain-containing protein [unclassified Caballeronia]|uniref:cupin domain-containing protein n=1 Tax=unclassified Caballeronia TaxID=2646786 RepID=UPI0028643E38|nr:MULTISPECIES: cupin domain-containing protein [unclassified Caballeronia]MDR5777324.1 cupin domain-containing protein [Caballeronia sp. LZ002]MDR5852744.1 cupin domain-containing protein [Caballeronia sp. LZ003]